VQPLLISRVFLFWPFKEGFPKRGTNPKGQGEKEKKTNTYIYMSVDSFAPSQPVSLLLNLKEAAVLNQILGELRSQVSESQG